MSNTISFEDFNKVDLRAGTIIEVHDFPEARQPAYKLTIDFGELGIKKQIGKFMSECLVLGAVKENDVILLNPENKVKNGTPVN